MLKDKRQDILNYIIDHKQYLDHNHKIYDIYSGNLLPYVVEVLKKTLSKNYYDKIEERIIPINILERYITKVASAYETPPKRIASNPTDQLVIDYYVRQFGLDSKMMEADSYSHMFKGYALDPFMDKVPKLRVIPYDRFLPYSDNKKDPTEETIMIKFMGHRENNFKKVECFYVYSDDEFDAFDIEGNTCEWALEENMGINPYGIIPIKYGKRAKNELMPVQDTDILSMSKLISVFLSDLSGAVLFQCFSIIYGIDLNMENAVMSPNALWDFKSDARSEKNPQIGVITPKADIDAVLRFTMSSFVLWLETKGIRVGSVGNMDAGNMASGISKIIDEMDVYKVVKKSIANFVFDEQDFWKRMAKVHNTWLETGEIQGMPKMTEDLEVQIIFQEPMPTRSRKDIIEEKKLEVDSGFKSKRKAIMELNPDMTEEELDLELAEMEGETTMTVDLQQPPLMS